jgi:dipeptidyl aminopeptidase/acylaminoacyl peptidase/tetratricopeptide (TPR) repeat protein
LPESRHPLLLATAFFAASLPLLAAERPLRVDDLFQLKDVSDPQLSPDGRFVAYTVTTLDAKKDRSDRDVYMAPLEGGEPLRLTSSKKAESTPRFSPDGEWIAFLSSREGRHAAVFLLSRRGGEAVKLTSYKAGVSDLAWSPDSKRLALVVSDEDPDAAPIPEDDEESIEPKKTAKPIVLRRLQFKRDGEGYLRELRSHLHVFDVARKTSFQLTSGPFDDSAPAWSPDGQRIAFVSNRTLPDPDLSQNSDVFVVAARESEVPRGVATGPSEASSPAWSPDGQWIAFIAGGDPKDMWYGASHLALVPAAGGTPRPLTAALDRNVLSPRFAPDGRSLLFVIEDGGNQHLARVGALGGAVERVVAGEREVQAFDVAKGGAIVVLESAPHQPHEISAVVSGGLRRITRANDDFLKGVRLGAVERFQAKGRDGTLVDGFLTLPPGHAPGARIPAILRIHGGPASQYSTAFELEWQLLAAHGYAVIAANPRGSTGYGTAFSRAIWADWGNKDFEDVMAAVDHVVAKGVADPDRLGVGGWSYGGMLTNYVVAKTQRFKAAVAGSGASNYLANYGTDHYQYEYELELGLPWKTRELWLSLSSPFFDAPKITTPTLFLCGALDVNVPLINSEQQYQVLRRVGKVETELVVYPDQWHSIRTPSYQKDKLERYLAWYDRFLRPGVVTAARAGADGAEAKPEATSLLGVPLFAPELTPDRQKALEANLARATADFVQNPDSADAAVWLGRRLGYLGRYREAIEAFTRGLVKHPNDARLLRHRGHRYISVRQLDQAVADLARAAELVKGRKDEPEPGSDPAQPTTTTLHFSVFYHLGLAHYLKGDFAAAEKAYRRCLEIARGNDDRLVAVSDWLYMTLRRLGKDAEAARVLEPIHADMNVTADRAYLQRLLMYKGVHAPDDLLRAGGDGVTRATYGYAVGNFHLVDGRAAEARAVFQQVTAGEQWAAFGYIAAEAELARMKKGGS